MNRRRFRQILCWAQVAVLAIVLFLHAGCVFEPGTDGAIVSWLFCACELLLSLFLLFYVFSRQLGNPLKATVVVSTTLFAVIFVGSVGSIERCMKDTTYRKLSAAQRHAINEERIQEVISKLTAGADRKSTQSHVP
ncbi:MAG TPA: hypothetical protein PLI59_00615 [Candidatus Obscuribacter sp.]|nr:hypothetical protein [Candidatus Obscuribacter sp.]MBL8081070.1 hypothetical protein [Candidatus Obscuribacter sp.]HND69692.1 hypothetical protein [Candidatus Obscuribacter sp.]HNG17647.1 hypothetical protein [Candidatus Obscuribacter sp.]